MSNRCDTCRWFEPNEDAERDFRGLDGLCALAKSQDGKPVHQSSLAVAADGEYYVAVLFVSEQFGCVQWEGK